MPFCTQCGKDVGQVDRFCRKCGAPQPLTGERPAANRAEYQRAAGGPPPPEGQLSPETASTLCYIPWFGFLMSIYVIAMGSYRNHKKVLFHAYQGLYLFVAWLLVDWIVEPLFDWLPDPLGMLGDLAKLLLVALWIIMLVRTHRGQKYSLPVFGELAQRSLA